MKRKRKRLRKNSLIHFIRLSSISVAVLSQKEGKKNCVEKHIK